MKNSNLYADPFGDQDTGASAQQVKNVAQPSAENDDAAGQDIDDNHGGINQFMYITDENHLKLSGTGASAKFESPVQPNDNFVPWRKN